MTRPEFGAEMKAAQPSKQAVDLIRLRRSTPADFLTEPGPDENALSRILEMAARVPDHRRVTPFRFILFTGKARAQFGEVLKQAFLKAEPDASADRAEYESNRFLRAPCVIAVISSVDKNHRTPEWEQILTAGAVCQNMLLGASATDFAAQWITEWYAYDQFVLKALGLGENERVAGFVYIGTAKENPKERARPDIDAIVSRL